jgi:hypothetical protein
VSASRSVYEMSLISGNDATRIIFVGAYASYALASM